MKMQRVRAEKWIQINFSRRPIYFIYEYEKVCRVHTREYDEGERVLSIRLCTLAQSRV
jgi:hypothetical protein